MTPKELDTVLRRHTEHEDMYLQGWQNPMIIQNMEEAVISGKKLHVLRLRDRTAPISGGQHSRFNNYPIHIHPWVEFNYMYSGSCLQRINGIPIELKQGQTLLLDQNTVHELPVLGENDILLNIFIHREYLDAGFFNRISQKNIISQFFVNAITEGVAHDSYIFFTSENSRRLPLFIQEFFCEYFDPSDMSEDTLSSLFTLIITELIQSYSATESFQAVAVTKDTSILPILKYIESHYRTVTLKEIATFFNLNPNYLSSLLKARTGSSFRDLVCKQRMAVAKNLLLNSKMSVTEVANAVGYDNTTFFYKKFEEQTGISVSASRRQQTFPP